MKTKILLVDDAKFMRMMLGEILGNAGYEVVAEANNAKEAIRIYREVKPDLVTMDIIMPGMSGLEAAREIIKLDPRAKIIMVSAMGQQELVKESLDAGASDFVVKPFVLDEVLEKVRKVLDHSYVDSK